MRSEAPIREVDVPSETILRYLGWRIAPLCHNCALTGFAAVLIDIFAFWQVGLLNTFISHRLLSIPDPPLDNKSITSILVN